MRRTRAQKEPLTPALSRREREKTRLPAEWEEHEATWIGWPHNTTDWPGKFAPIPWVYGEIVRKLAPGEIVRVLVESKEHEASARRILERCGAEMSRVEFFRFPTNRGWTRDSGPTFVQAGDAPRRIAIRRFRFNGWARYDDWKKDEAIPPKVAKALGIPLLPGQFRAREVVLEGGAIDVNGAGTLVTTEECLLDEKVQVRNPGMTRRDYEEAFAGLLGVTNVLWLNRGIAGDDTHGHVDDIARFVNPRTIALCRETNSADENHRVLEENREQLEGMRLEDGSKVEIVFLPMPAPLYLDGRRLPASYANFYVGNAAVLVPTFNDPKDRLALTVLSGVFRDRPVVGIHAVDLVWGLGTLHCLTRQQPR
ncbi:MAG TPA: agmatine deiminase family protein [Thermoanaerobaculia bacterium]|jgi:agmatine deiminase|nr:agmatine deiminase family protein [Thermoanaerobaculia bacterium]